jgi:PIN domain
MDIVLDSNIYLTDIRLRSNRFANFFDYVRRTRSSILLPALVRDEVVQKHREKLTIQLSRVEKELKELRRYTMDDVTFHAPYLKGETNDLKALLRRPSKSVRTKFLASMDGVDLKEIVRRGINRVPPASESGEELRDVILWLITLDHAKSTSRPTAFVTADAGFWEADKPKGQILQDIDSAKVDIRLYKDLAEFTRDNALVSEPVTYAWIDAHLSGATLEEMIAGPLRDSLKASRRVTGDIQKVTSTQIRFVDGSIYKIDARTDFAELRYRGFFVVETVSVRYDFSQFESLPSAQGFGSLRSLTSPEPVHWFPWRPCSEVLTANEAKLTGIPMKWRPRSTSLAG